MSYKNARLNFSKKAKPINRVEHLAYEDSNHEPIVIAKKEETMNSTQNHSVSIPHSLAELLVDILARASATYSDSQ